MKQEAISGGAVKQIEKKKPAAKKAKKKPISECVKNTWLSKQKQDNDAEEKVEEDATNQSGFKEYKNPEIQPDPEFETFVRSYKTMDVSEYVHNALEYLRSGLPFKGDHLKLYKGSLKESGAKWFKNENHVQGEWGSKFGWFVAISRRELKSLLQLPLTKNGDKAWTPCGIAEEESIHFVCKSILALLEEFEQNMKDGLEKKRREAEAERDSKKQRLRQDAAGQVREDTEEDIRRLVEKLSINGDVWEYDSGFIQSSATSDRLGPAMSTNAKRVLRALHLKILTPEDVLSGDFHGFDRREENARRMKIEKRIDARPTSKQTSSKEKVGETFQMEKEDDDSYVAERIFLKTDAELERVQEVEVARKSNEESMQILREMRMASEHQQASLDTRPVVETVCNVCKHTATDQFGCECSELKWTACKECRKLEHSMQRCCCCSDFPDVEFPVETAASGVDDGKKEGEAETQGGEEGEEGKAAAALPSPSPSTAASVPAIVESKEAKQPMLEDKQVLSEKQLGKKAVRFLNGFASKYAAVGKKQAASVTDADPDL